MASIHPPQHVLAWEVPTTVLQAMSVSSTLIRLTHRWRTKRMWWDDIVVFIPVAVDILLIIVDWLAATTADRIVTSKSFLYSPWFGTFLYFTVLWISRVSLALSIARIFPPKHSCRRFSFGLTVLFLVLYIPNVLMPIFECKASLSSGSSAWFGHGQTLLDCVKNKPAPSDAIFTSFALDFVADILLIISPLAMLWKIKLPRQERTLILFLFSSSILSLMASIAYVIIWALSAQFGSDSRLAIKTIGQIQAAISLLVCNLLVVAMLFYRMSRREIRTPIPHYVAPPTSTSLALDLTRQGIPSEKDNFTVDCPRSQGHGTDNTCWVSQLQEDSILAISFTTVFEDSTDRSRQGDLSARSTPSLNKLSAGTPSIMFYHQNHSLCSSDSKIPPWSFSDCSEDITSRPDP